MKRHILPLLFIAFVSIALYANTLQNGFVYDDEFTVVENAGIKRLDNLPDLIDPGEYFSLSGEVTYRPVVTITYFIDYYLYGLKPWGFHLTNLLLHALNGVLLYIFLALSAINRTQDSRSFFNDPPFIISLLFSTHPVLTEAVNGVSFREDLLCFFFYISTLILYLIIRSNRYSLSKVMLYALSCLTCFLALLSKEMAATLPLIVLCYEFVYWDRKGGIRSALLNPYLAGYISVTLIYIFLRFGYFYNPAEGFPAPILTERLLTIPWIMITFIKLALFPVSLSIRYDIDPVTSIFSDSFLWPFSAILLLILFILRLKKDILFGALFFIITLLPVLNNIIPTLHPIAERYLYLPGVGFAVVLGLFIIKICKSLDPKYFYASLFIILFSFSLLVVKRNTAWKNELSLWSDTVRRMPTNSKAHNNLGMAYYDQGLLDYAILEFKESIRLNPDFVYPYFNLGLLYKEKGLKKESRKAFENALRLNPEDAEVRQELKTLEGEN